MESETFRVRLCGMKETVNGIILLEVAVRSLQDDYELSARIVQAPSNQSGLWPHNDNPKTFVNVIQDFHRDYQNGPIVVMDRYARNSILLNVSFLCRNVEWSIIV